MNAFTIRYRNTQGTLMRILNAASRRGLDLPYVQAEAAEHDHQVMLWLEVNQKQVGQLYREWCAIADVLLVGSGPSQAAEQLAEEGTAVEVVDPRTLVPLDKQAILASVAKTGRLVTVDMAHKTCSAASEIAALVAMEGFWSLQAPIQRLGTANVHIPFSPALESLVYPTAETIAKAVRTTLE